MGYTLTTRLNEQLGNIGAYNISLRTGTGGAAPTVTDNLKGLGTATPPAGGCSAGNWDATKVYSPASRPADRADRGQVQRQGLEGQGGDEGQCPGHRS